MDPHAEFSRLCAIDEAWRCYKLRNTFPSILFLFFFYWSILVFNYYFFPFCVLTFLLYLDHFHWPISEFIWTRGSHELVLLACLFVHNLCSIVLRWNFLLYMFNSCPLKLYLKYHFFTLFALDPLIDETLGAVTNLYSNPSDRINF